jgi:hypothetical protein
VNLSAYWARDLNGRIAVLCQVCSVVTRREDALLAGADSSLEALRSAVELACQPQNTRLITAGRQQVLAMPRAWVLQEIEKVAAEALDLTDYWEYRRLLELAGLLDAELVRRLVSLGLGSSDPDVREAAEDFRNRPGLK